MIFCLFQKRYRLSVFVSIFFVCTFVSFEWLQDSLGREGGSVGVVLSYH